jgi:GNAT superfamily N-acetyltransferase
MQSVSSRTQIREIDPESADEISLVASRMRQTLVEVLGEEKGVALYSMDWLIERVRWHLDPRKTRAKVFLAGDRFGQIVAHAIARVEYDDQAKAFGYFSTIFVEPKSRSQGIAGRLLEKVESWFKAMEMPKIVYNTAGNHSKLIRLLERRGYRITHRESEMVQLTQQLP